jgi:hypothetical protein
MISTTLMKAQAAAVLAIALTATAAHAATTLKTATLTIDPMAMSPDASNRLSTQYTNMWDQGLVGNGKGPNCFNTGVNLPQGAKITNVTVFYMNNHPTAVYAELRRKALATPDTVDVAYKTLPLTNGDRRQAALTLNASYATINNNVYGYGFGVCLNDERGYFYGAKITYQYTPD